MNITVINGTEKHGVTYRLKEMFLTEFRDEANITEYYLPKDCPNFCVGCLNCTLKGEKTCKDAEYIRKMDESLLKADLITKIKFFFCRMIQKSIHKSDPEWKDGSICSRTRSFDCGKKIKN